MSTGGTSESSHWGSSSGGGYSHGTAGVNLVSGTTGLSHTVDSELSGEVIQTLVSVPESGTVAAHLTWSMSSGSGDSTGSTVDGWNYAGGGNYSGVLVHGDPSTTGTIQESGSDGTTSAYQIHADWNAASQAWEKTGDKSVVDLSQGHWESSGTAVKDSYWNDVPHGVTYSEATTSLVHSKDWSTEETSAQHLAAGATTWTTNKDDTKNTYSTRDTTDTAAGNNAYQRSFDSHGTGQITGTITGDYHNSASQSFNYGTTWGQDGSYHYFGSGHAEKAGSGEHTVDANMYVSQSLVYEIYNPVETHTKELTYQESGDQSSSQFAATDWAMNPNGSWRETRREKTQSGRGEGHVDFTGRYHYTPGGRLERTKGSTNSPAISATTTRKALP